VVRTGRLLLTAVILLASVALGQDAVPGKAAYSDDGRMTLPGQYRQWVYLTSGFDMSYSPAARSRHHLFDNLFVNPEAYRGFLATGRWPDGTVLVLELRGAVAKDPTSRQGDYQGADVVGVEVHARDTRRFAGGWGFFSFDGKGPAKLIPQSATCYSCHGMHGAVDTTFVQYYPTLLPIARRKGTLSASYRQETTPTTAR
jgi:Cytochrome P460